MRPTALALATGLLISGAAALAAAAADQADRGGDDAVTLEPSRKLQPPPRGDAAKQLPIILRAQALRARPDIDASAQGEVEFRRGGTVIRADSLGYDVAGDLARANGHVRIERADAIYQGPELQLQVQRFEGYFLEPQFEFPLLGAGGRAERVDFIDSGRASATNAIYTSCPRDGSGDPDWVLQARRVQLDFDSNVGIAEGAVLRFLGAPILALPTLSFPLNDGRKSGWLPPSVNLDSRSGLELSIPYYWNIAPNRDATLTPRVLSKRGLGLDSEFRYLEPRDNGALNLTLLPNDRVADRSRESVQWVHEGNVGPGLRYAAEVSRVSDNSWWKDFPDVSRSLTPRLLPARASIERDIGDTGGRAYLRTQQWQVLQDSDQLVTAPYQRSPQVGVRFGSRPDGSDGGAQGAGIEYAVEGEFNRFTLPDGEPDPTRQTGMRWHSLGSVSYPMREAGYWVVPKLAFNAAAYRTDTPMSDGRRDAHRVIPTLSIDAGLEFERETEALGRALRQTLEPRLLYVNTPFRAQSGLPNFDAAGKDFNFSSIYSENAFSGVDRVSDSHELTAGVTTRLVDATTGAEALRLGLVQRYLFRDQRVAPQADGTADGPPLTQPFSDLLLLASGNVVKELTLDSAVQYSPDISRAVRSVVGVRYSPGPYQTFSTTYRFTRDLSEQLEIGWQWPLRFSGGDTPAALAQASGVGAAAVKSGAGQCGGTWYAVGRVNYSMRDSRVTDSIVGAEYDAGCWIARVVAERLSTGTSEATTRLLLQLELVGLSRIGSNPLKVLKDNIPGYRLLREDRRAPTSTTDE